MVTDLTPITRYTNICCWFLGTLSLRVQLGDSQGGEMEKGWTVVLKSISLIYYCYIYFFTSNHNKKGHKVHILYQNGLKGIKKKESRREVISS